MFENDGCNNYLKLFSFKVWVGARKGSGNSWTWPSGTPVFQRMHNGPCSVVKFGGGRGLLKGKPCTADAGWERNVVCSIPIEA